MPEGTSRHLGGLHCGASSTQDLVAGQAKPFKQTHVILRPVLHQAPFVILSAIRTRQSNAAMRLPRRAGKFC
jgi:hypothetical protein